MNTPEENGLELTYAYGPDQSRYKGIWKNNGTQYRKRIYASGYEINEETVNGVTTTQNISYVSSPGGLCAIYVEENGSGTFYYVHTDHLGSITSVTNANGNIIARQNFDAWGRRRKVQDYSYLPQNTTSTDNGLNNNGTLPKWLYRGYTGHEHLDEFALINMNARLYDPVVGMFLSPDNYIQAPGNTQNYNRYAYCLNNPLKYSDPSGNITYAAMAGFIHGFTSTSEGRFKAGFMEAGRRVENSLKIWNGLVTYNTHYSGKGDLFRDAGEIISRLTWQLPQTLVGFGYAHVSNLGNDVTKVEYFFGATLVHNEWLGKNSVSLGSFISLGTKDEEAAAGIGSGAYTTMHEYGHYLQSKEYGPLYLIKVGIPSAVLNTNWTEHDANQRAANFFQKHDESFVWDQYHDKRKEDWFDPNNPGKPSRYYLLPNQIRHVSPVEHSLFFSMASFRSPLLSLFAFHLLILENSK